tara:strand:- start:578 stop:886 length:309 start_codon:yes stop_codon:yes gene_type:complete
MTDKIEEELYLQANKEIEEGDTNEGTWAKAFANAEGSEEKTKALYIKYRVKNLKEEEEDEDEEDSDDTDMGTAMWFGAILAIVGIVLIFGIWKLLQFFGILG